MMISTKGRYALRVMLDIAENQKEGYIPMKEISKRQEISLKYLERIIPPLVKGGLLEGVSGKGGGYKLTKNLEDYSVGEILRLTEGDLAPVACLSKDAKPCKRSEYCKTLPMWKKLDKKINNFFDQMSLESLL